MAWLAEAQAGDPLLRHQLIAHGEHPSATDGCDGHHQRPFTNVAETECASAPLVPVTVKGYCVLAVGEATVMVRVADVPVAEAGLNDALAPEGRPATDRETAPVNPPVRVMVTL